MRMSYIYHVTNVLIYLKGNLLTYAICLLLPTVKCDVLIFLFAPANVWHLLRIGDDHTCDESTVSTAKRNVGSNQIDGFLHNLLFQAHPDNCYNFLYDSKSQLFITMALIFGPFVSGVVLLLPRCIQFT